MTFEEAVIRLAQEDGVKMLLQIPGVWEHVSESYNNEALELMERENEARRYKVHGYAHGEDGDVIHLGTVYVTATSVGEADNKAYSELWDARLSSASCSWSSNATEEEEDDE